LPFGTFRPHRTARAESSVPALRDGRHVRRLGTFFALARLELDLRAFGEGLEAIACDLRVVDKQILATFLRRDEPVALRIAEPLHGSSCHRKNTSLTKFTNG